MSSSSTAKPWSRAGSPNHRERDLPRQAWRAYWEATALLQDRLERALKQEADLSLSDYNLLLLLTEAGGSMRMGEIADRMVFVPSRITYRVKLLVDKGLVCRDTESTDRRASIAAITPGGEKVFKNAAHLHSKQVEEFFLQHLEQGEAETILNVFTKVGRHIDNLD